MRTKSLAVAALFMALVMVTTAFVKIPLPLTGYIHLGDTFIFLACFFLKKPYAIAASAMGSALGRRHRLSRIRARHADHQGGHGAHFLFDRGRRAYILALRTRRGSPRRYGGSQAITCSTPYFLWGGARRFSTSRWTASSRCAAQF